MGVFAIGVLGTAIFSAFLAVVADWRWPAASAQRLGLICGLTLPVLILMAYPLALLWIWATPSNASGADVDGMTLIVIGMFLAFALLASLLVGLPVACLTLAFLRKKM